MFDSHIYSIYVENEGTTTQHLSIQEPEIAETVVSLAQTYGANTVVLNGNEAYCSRIKNKIAEEATAQYGNNDLLIHII